jgi:3-isopropylmalate dehydrogenase
VLVRENTEGLYASRGGGVRVGGHVAIDTLVVTRAGAARICRQAFELARRRGGAPLDGQRRVTCVDKANVLKSFAFFREVFDEVAGDYPEVEAGPFIDAMAAYLVRPRPLRRPRRREHVRRHPLDLAAATGRRPRPRPVGDIGEHHGLFQPSTGPPRHRRQGSRTRWRRSSGRPHARLAGRRHGDDRRWPPPGGSRRQWPRCPRRRVLTPDLGGAATTAAVGDAVAASL